MHDVAQVYGPNGSVGGNARVEGEAWVLGRVDGDAEICDLVVIAEYAHVGGRAVVCGDEIVRGDVLQQLAPCRAEVSATGGLRVSLKRGCISAESFGPAKLKFRSGHSTLEAATPQI